MKLVELAKKATRILEEAGEKGINNIELSEKLQMPRRRVYDIIAILRAADLVESKREKGGSRISWKSIPSIEPSAPSTNELKLSDKLKDKITKIEEENNDLKEKIKRLQKDISKGAVERTSDKQLFEASGIVVRADKSLKITEVVNSGIEITIKASGKGIVVEPIPE
ncbi:MAG TPA: hypothetical protein VMV49_09990 [Candidatus Deferrimicrobium sp.]|nr:hypothetical protein [Candidatus Deferrimicrobium sp.]